MRINHNIAALNTYRQLSNNNAISSKSLEKLSSGLRINRAGDDAAGLAISEKMRGQIRGLDQAQRNAQDAISMIQTAEGALNETHSILQRMRELAVQAANDTNTAVDRAEIQKEVDQLAIEITRIANNTEFNTQTLLNGGIKSTGLGEATFHIGANASQTLVININAMDAKSLGVSRDLVTASATTQGDIDTASFGDTLGAKVVDGATITFQYSAGSAATAASLTGAAAAPTTDLTGISVDATLTVNIDGTNYTLNQTTLQSATGAGKTITDLQNALQTAIGAAGTVSNDGTKLTIQSATTGSTSSVKITIAGTTTAGIDTAFGFTSGASATGTDAVGKNITVSDGTTSQVVTITDETATSFTVSSGNYQGITITMDTGKALSDLDSVNDKIVVSVTTDAASAATFSGNEKIADAVTKAGINVSTQSAANAAITVIQNAIETVSAERSKLGAYQNRLEHTINNLGTSAENLSAAESRIRDVDYAEAA
ncbi:flagellin [Pelotomaculum thermopropionicum SI]|uniref:Flagellin n=1 Tax=Pelotomaculum thermopropionicum (strain DSM 13744 / JCM 10971 / SI) TaxID=370438 RepID=A5D0D2_PELTS|nr:flagellin [Pelotomaculum thermopropionicum SI]